MRLPFSAELLSLRVFACLEGIHCWTKNWSMWWPQPTEFMALYSTEVFSNLRNARWVEIRSSALSSLNMINKLLALNFLLGKLSDVLIKVEQLDLMPLKSRLLNWEAFIHLQTLSQCSSVLPELLYLPSPIPILILNSSETSPSPGICLRAPRYGSLLLWRLGFVILSTLAIICEHAPSVL